MRTQNVIESEFHFLLHCPKYREIRERYFKNILWPTLYKFNSLMSSKSKSTVFVINIAKYIREALAIRDLF